MESMDWFETIKMLSIHLTFIWLDAPDSDSVL